jgi:hypothetical protein
MYVIRVEFPDEDKYAYVTNDEGELKKFYNREDAEKVAQTYSGNPIVIKREDDEGISWSV